MMNGDTILKLNHITKRFSGLVAVNDLSLEMKKRTIHALIGPNGSGKTTTVNQITGTYAPTDGEIYYKDTCPTLMQPDQIARLGISRTFQNLKLFQSMTVMENLMVGGHQMTKLGILQFLYRLREAGREERILRESAEEVLEYRSWGFQGWERKESSLWQAENEGVWTGFDAETGDTYFR